MTFIRNLVLLLATALMLVLASPTSDPLTRELLARAQGEPNLDCGSHASESAIASSKSNVTAFDDIQPELTKPIHIHWYAL